MSKLKVKYAEIIINNKHAKLDRPFTYRAEGDLASNLKRGMRVVIPFGQGNRLIKGVVINILDEFHGEYELKNIIDIIDDKPLISKELMELSMWMGEEYLASYIDCFRQVFPPGDFRKINSFIELNEEAEEKIEINQDEGEILDYLKEKKIVLLDDLKKDMDKRNLNIILDGMKEKNLITSFIDMNKKVEKKYQRRVRLDAGDKGLEEIRELIGNRAKKQREIAEFLYQVEDISFKELSEVLSTGLATVRALEERGLVKIYEKQVDRDPIRVDIEDYKKHILSPIQEGVYRSICENFQEPEDNKFLIRGVTGSGKTEIYLQLVEEMLLRGKQSIILVPEISLTPQTIDRFVGRFGDTVALMHSRLSPGERFDEWRRMKNGRARIVVGARSAVFAPFDNLGLIIIDEEHESSYKSSQNPKYNTVDLAEKRVDLEEAFLVMGSATPSLDSYHRALEGRYKLLELDKRVNEYEMPRVSVVDMREELRDGNKTIFSRELEEAMAHSLEEGKQIILFLNRRGFSTFVSCRECGYVVKCKDCDISMTYHRKINRVRCHYCGLTEHSPETCPVCKSKYIKYFGVGTEQVEEYTRKIFPKARVARMDLDTTSRKGSYDRILGGMKNREIDILIGTQMISKGLDFKDVTLVGVIAADTSLNLPDFRAPERTFQLITQVAGRAGRGVDKGKVVVQTYDPDHYSIVFSKEHDYKAFYHTEIGLRESFMYPPFYKMINILLYGENLKKVMDTTHKVYNLIYKLASHIEDKDKGNYIIGPNPAPLEKIKNNFRWHIILKTEEKDINTFKKIIKGVLIDNEYKLDLKDIRTSIDINPNSIL